MKPTILRGNSSALVTVPLNESRDSLSAPSATNRLSTGMIVLENAQLAIVQETVDKLDFISMPSGDIVILGHEAETALHQTLDGFLARLNKENAGRLFDLFGKLEKGVKDADLPDLLERLKTGEKQGFFAKFRSRKSVQDALQQAYQETVSLLTGKTKTLQTVMGDLERELQQEMRNLFTELSALDTLKVSYRQHIGNFAVAAATAIALQDRATVLLEEKRIEVAQNPDPLAQSELQELENKLQLLQSRALALEGVFTALPANQLVIQQIENAGVATLQETATTASSRFGSIKMTLLALHGAVSVKGLQNLSQRHDQLDQQLGEIRGALTKEIVTSAANAPGDNRLAQAAQLEKIIKETTELQAIVVTARTANEAKFDTARQQFAAARDVLARLPQAP